MAHYSSSEKPEKVSVYPKSVDNPCKVILSINIEEHTKDGIIMYSRDQYDIETEYYDGIEKDIEDNFDEWVQRGIAEEEKRATEQADLLAFDEAVARMAVLQAETLPDDQAVDVKALYPHWASRTEYTAGDRRQHGAKLYKCLQAHTSQDDWTPDVVPALWAVIDETHKGTKDDPIPAQRNMEYFNKKYYSEGEKLYRCTRDSGIPLYYLPSELVGQYFEEVER